MNLTKKVIRVFFSMTFAISILVILTAACIIGSVIPQGEIASFYEAAYPSCYNLIHGFCFDDVFHSLWFVILTIILCINLLGCNLIRFPGLIKQFSREYKLENRAKRITKQLNYEIKENPEKLFKRLGFRKIEKSDKDGKKICYSARNRFGIMGAWLTHLGMLVIIIGFSLGQINSTDYTVYGVPGQSKMIGDTGLMMTINDFDIVLREDDTVEQYTSNLTISNDLTGETMSGETSVNHPFNAFGYEMYQNATGYAADVIIYKNDEFLQVETLCVGEYFAVDDLPDLMVAFRAFYPDYAVNADGMPITASDHINNPAYLYILYYQQEMLGMNVLNGNQMITVSDYKIIFTNPQMYTLIQIKHDPYQNIALIGGILILSALFISFYCRTEELWAVEDNDRWLIGGVSRKGGLLFEDKLKSTIIEFDGQKLSESYGAQEETVP